MPSHFEDELSAIEAEITEQEAKLVNLRRHRNMMMPIARLSAELISNIIGHLIAHCSPEGDKLESSRYAPKFSFFSWVSVTQFCAQWRGVALDDASLWTYLWTTNLGWFSTFLERSNSRLLHIDTHLPEDGRGIQLEMFRLIAKNMHRVSSLHLRPQFDCMHIYSLRDVPAPQMEVLRILDRTNMPSCCYRLPNPVNPGVMPRLRELYISSSQNAWDVLLPMHLPAVTNLTISGMPAEAQLNLISRCPAVRFLSSTAPSKQGWNDSQNVSPVVLPKLQHLCSRNAPWAMFNYLTFPSIQTMAITTSSMTEDPAQAFSILTKLLQSSRVLDLTPLRFHLASTGRNLAVVLEDATGGTPLRLGINFVFRDIAGAKLMHLPVLNNLLQLVHNVNGVIQSLHLEGRGCTDHRIFHFFRDNTDVSEIDLQNLQALMIFLSLFNVKECEHSCSTRTVGRECDIFKLCRDTCILCYPSLETLTVNVDDYFKAECETWFKLLVEWLKERKKRGLSLAKLRVKSNVISDRSLNAVKKIVDDVIVERCS